MRCIGWFEHYAWICKTTIMPDLTETREDITETDWCALHLARKVGYKSHRNLDRFATLTEIRWFDYSCMSIQNCNCAGFNNGQKRHSANRLMSNTFGSTTLTRIVDISATETEEAWFEYLILKMESANNSTRSNANNSTRSNANTSRNSTALTTLLFDFSINSDLSTHSHFSINRSTLIDQQLFKVKSTPSISVSFPSL